MLPHLCPTPGLRHCLWWERDGGEESTKAERHRAHRAQQKNAWRYALCAMLLFIQRSKLFESFISLFYGVIQSLFRGLLAGKNILHLCFYGIPDGHKIPQTNSLTIGGRFPFGNLSESGPQIGIFTEMVLR